MYYRSAPCVIIVFDVCNVESFNEVKSFWVSEIRSKGVVKADIYLVGNKTDRPDR